MSSRPVLLATFLIAAFASCNFIVAGDIFEEPVRLKADGKIIDTGPMMGHSGPCIEDIDGDGLNDLIVGHFFGKFEVFKNVGQNNNPVYEHLGQIKAGGKLASVTIYCCVGAQPRFVDLDGDGIKDLISSSYDPGYCYFFKGLEHQQFAAGKELIDKAGIPVRSNIQQKQEHQSFGSFFTPVDWDADGDFDLLIGCFDGTLKLRINEGSRIEPIFASENLTVDTGNEQLKFEAHCCPVVADWNNDGLWDILIGRDDGCVSYYQNSGTTKSPKFGEGKTIVKANDTNGHDLLRWTDDDIVPGIRSQIEVTDYNGDGKLDLILGDFCRVFDVKEQTTSGEKEFVTSLVDEFKRKKRTGKLAQLQANFLKKHPGDKRYSDDAETEWTQIMTTFRNSPEVKEREERENKFVKEMRPFLATTGREVFDSTDLPVPRGYVWLFLRK